MLAQPGCYKFPTFRSVYDNLSLPSYGHNKNTHELSKRAAATATAATAATATATAADSQVYNRKALSTPSHKHTNLLLKYSLLPVEHQSSTNKRSKTSKLKFRYAIF